MWQVHAALHFGQYRTPECDVTPVIACLGFTIHTGL
jgi:hypothetical protein